MAQAVRHDEVEIESQAKEMPLLIQTVGQNNANDQKMSDVYLRAEELKYANPEGWEIGPNFAVLNGSDELRVSGEYSTQKLGSKDYEVYFHLRLNDNCNINEVELTLALPDGSTQKHTEGLEMYPRNKRISIKAGKFFNKYASANIEFELSGTECYIKNEGLVIYGVLIKANT